MGSCNKVVLSVLFLFCSMFMLGQKDVDSLLNKSYDELFTELNQADGLTLKDRYARAVIKKAKNENNRDLLIGGYHTQAIIHNDETMLLYCDSIIALTMDSPNKMMPAEAFQLKGDHYYNNKN